MFDSATIEENTRHGKQSLWTNSGGNTNMGCCSCVFCAAFCFNRHRTSYSCYWKGKLHRVYSFMLQ